MSYSLSFQCQADDAAAAASRATSAHLTDRFANGDEQAQAIADHFGQVVHVVEQLAAAVGRPGDILAVSVSGHANVDHAPSENWADEYLQVGVRILTTIEKQSEAAEPVTLPDDVPAGSTTVDPLPRVPSTQDLNALSARATGNPNTIREAENVEGSVPPPSDPENAREQQRASMPPPPSGPATGLEGGPAVEPDDDELPEGDQPDRPDDIPESAADPVDPPVAGRSVDPAADSPSPSGSSESTGDDGKVMDPGGVSSGIDGMI